MTLVHMSCRTGLLYILASSVNFGLLPVEIADLFWNCCMTDGCGSSTGANAYLIIEVPLYRQVYKSACHVDFQLMCLTGFFEPLGLLEVGLTVERHKTVPVES